MKSNGGLRRAAARTCAPDFLPAPGEIRRSLQLQFEQLMAHEESRIYWDVLSRLEALSFDYVVSALRLLGLVFEPGRRFSTAEIARPPRHPQPASTTARIVSSRCCAKKACSSP